MEELMGLLLGPPLKLFYPLLIASFLTLVYGVVKRSWKSMLISGILLFPDAWYFSGYPSFPYTIFIPIMIILISIVMYRLKRRT
jgi:hypothetical protein